jgi:hypothetical protein
MIRGVFGAFVLSLVLGSSAIAQTCSVPNTLTNGTNADATQVMANFNAILTCLNNAAAPGAIRSYLSGLTLSTTGSSANFGVAVGVATSDDTTTSMKLSTSYAKTTSAWAVGSGSGSLDTGTIANNTWYHVFLIERTDTGVVDVLVSLSATTPTLPANYTKQRRIGSMKTNGSIQWILFSQNGDEFLWDVPTQENVGLNNTTAALTITTNVPTGIQVQALPILWFNPSAVLYVFVSALDSADILPSISNFTTVSLTGAAAQTPFAIRTSTAGQYRFRASAASTASLYTGTRGWIDRRGRDQ